MQSLHLTATNHDHLLHPHNQTPRPSVTPKGQRDGDEAAAVLGTQILTHGGAMVPLGLCFQCGMTLSDTQA